MAGPLVSVDWLLDALAAPARGEARRRPGGRPAATPGEPPQGIRIVDCRYRLGEPDAGKRLWRESHIPGAAFLDVDRDLAATPGERGRHPLPEPHDFEAAARRAGIGADTTVIATTRRAKAAPRASGGSSVTSVTPP